MISMEKKIFHINKKLNLFSKKKSGHLEPGWFDSSELTYLSNFTKECPDEFVGWTTLRVVQEGRNDTKFHIPSNIETINFYLPIQDGAIVYYANPFPIEFVYRTDGTKIFINGRWVNITPSTNFEASTTDVGEGVTTKFGKIIVSEVIDKQDQTFQKRLEEVNKKLIYIPDVSYGLIYKIRGGGYFLLRYQAAKSLADIDICLAAVLTNRPLYTEDFSQWASLKDSSKSVFSFFHEMKFKIKYFKKLKDFKI